MSHTRDDQIDLEWFFNEAAGDLSMPSSFGAMVARLQLGKQAKAYATSANAENYIERQLDACQRYTEVETSLRLLSAARRRVLEEAFEQCRCPVEIVARPRHLFKAARGAPAMHEFLKGNGDRTWTVDAANEWLARAENPQAKAGQDVTALDALSVACWSQGLDTVTKALEAYSEARTVARREAKADQARRFARSCQGAPS